MSKRQLLHKRASAHQGEVIPNELLKQLRRRTSGRRPRDPNITFTPEAGLDARVFDLDQKRVAALFRKTSHTLNLSGGEYNESQHSAVFEDDTLETLILSDNFLSTVPVDIIKLTNLVELFIDNNSIKDLPNEMCQLEHLKTLRAQANKLSHWPACIFRLPSLCGIFMQNNALQDVPEPISALQSLETLHLGWNKISSVARGLFECKNLSKLYLNHNVISGKFPSQLGNLVNLKILNLKDNGIESLPDSIGQLKNLEVLRLANNKLEELPKVLHGLVSLKTLELSGNAISTLSDDIGRLVRLQRLSLDDNQIYELPNALGFLSRLMNVNLSRNKLMGLPASFYALKNIKTLKLASNSLRQFSHHACQWEHLEYLDLSDNKLQTLPCGLANMKATIKLDKNPLETMPPDIIARGSKSILQFLSQLEEKAPWRRMKLMFVGEEAVGKTSLRMALSSTSDRERSSSNGKTKTQRSAAPVATDGIDITEWAPQGLDSSDENSLIFSCWDFAGQEVYYPTHQFFLTTQCIYIMCFNLVDENPQPRLEYWLKTIKRHAPKANCLIVGTHMDDKACHKKHLQMMIDKMKKLQRKYNTIKDIIPLSSKTLKGVDILTQKIIEIAMNQPSIKAHVPRSYIFLEGKIKTLRYQKQMIAVEDFKALARACGISSGNAVKVAMTFMSDVGLIIHFNYAASALKDIVVLNPQWVADLMSSIVTMRFAYGKSSALSRGILEEKELSFIWHNYPEDLYRGLLKLLEKFEIAFQVMDVTSSSLRYIVPCLLPEKPDEQKLNESWGDWNAENYKDSCGRIYDIGFLPLGFFSRYFIRAYHIPHLKPVYYWKYGMVAKLGQQRALITYDPTNFEVSFTVRSINDPISDMSTIAGRLLRYLSNSVEIVLRGWYKTTASQIWITCNCIACRGNQPTLYSYEEIMHAIQHSEYLACIKDEVKTVVNPADVAPDIALKDLQQYAIASEEIQLGDQIGRGGSGIVYTATYKEQTVAVKVLSEQCDDTALYRELQYEAYIMCQIRHKNLVEFLGLCSRPSLSVVMEFCELGSLADYLTPESDKFRWRYRVKGAMDVAQGMKYLHNQDYIHRDLRSPNILVASLNHKDNIRLKLTDFGTIVRYASYVQYGDFNPRWAAPEILRQEKYTQSVDVYSFGVVLWEMLQIGFPYAEYKEFDGTSRLDFEEAIINGLRPTIPVATPKKYKELIKWCWSDEAINRPTFDQVISYLKAWTSKKLRDSSPSSRSLRPSR